MVESKFKTSGIFSIVFNLFLCLVVLWADGKKEKIITGMYYENIDELQAALSSIKYLGFFENLTGKALKALLNEPATE
ncbi:MAG TPA: hypothetical protein VNS58_31265 [Puia sp.]|nr:hypothetical protein [Puia sp.]